MLGANVVVQTPIRKRSGSLRLTSRRSSAEAAAPRAAPAAGRTVDGTALDSGKWEVDQTLSVSFVGSLRYVQAALEEFIGRTQADELILVAQVHDHAARLRSYELAATCANRLNAHELTSQTLHGNVVRA